MRLIDADALKRKAQKFSTEAWKTNRVAKVTTILNQFIDWIDGMPTIDAAEVVRYGDDWIPCSEKLPDVGEIVIASWSDLWSDAIVFARRYCEDDWEWAYEHGSDYWESARDYDIESNPEAWMPLPEPYEPKTER